MSAMHPDEQLSKTLDKGGIDAVLNSSLTQIAAQMGVSLKLWTTVRDVLKVITVRMRAAEGRAAFFQAELKKAEEKQTELERLLRKYDKNTKS